MGSWLRRVRSVPSGARATPKHRSCRLALEPLETRCLLTTGAFLQTNLVADIPGLARLTDPNLVNPWGISFSSSSPFWVSNQATQTSTLYVVNASGVSINSRVVTIPNTPMGPQGPTGQVQNGTSSFVVGTGPASFIFANLNGTISGWNAAAGNSAVIEAMMPGAVFTALAIASNGKGDFLYAADDSIGQIDVFDGSYQPVDLGPNAFVDPELPSGLVPFNVQNIGANIYVTYAPAGRIAQVNAQEGDGAVAVFDTSGNFINQLITGSTLASPWGITLAPASFGDFGGDLLVGNFAYNVSEINAFDPTTGEYQGTLSDLKGNRILNQALWAIKFGNGGSGGLANTLFFAAGIQGEAHGLFGSIQAIPTTARRAPVLTNLPRGAVQSFSTVPDSNGDLNPYGVAFVPPDFPAGGMLNPGDILVSNFNNSDNLQGTGTTIINFGPAGDHSIFFQGDTGLGLTTALGVLRSGFVIVGNVPTDDGTFDTIHQGSLLVLDSNGNVVETLTDNQLLDGPWDLTIRDAGSRAQVFVSNVLSGSVTRIDLSIPPGGMPIVQSETMIASGYMHEENDAALVVGPTGLAYDARRDILYVASTDDNAIFAIRNASRARRSLGTGMLIYQDNDHLHGPLALVLAQNGNLITANGDAVNEDDSQPSELVEFTPSGTFVDQFSISSKPGGAFGIAIDTTGGFLRFAAVNDNTNEVRVWTFQFDMAPNGGDSPHARRDVVPLAAEEAAPITATSTGDLGHISVTGFPALIAPLAIDVPIWTGAHRNDDTLNWVIL